MKTYVKGFGNGRTTGSLKPTSDVLFSTWSVGNLRPRTRRNAHRVAATDLEAELSRQVAEALEDRRLGQVEPTRGYGLVRSRLSRPQSMASAKGGTGMNAKTTRATAAAVAQSQPTRTPYHVTLSIANEINEILGSLLISLETALLTSLERTAVLDSIDGLIRLKIEAGLLRGECP